MNYFTNNLSFLLLFLPLQSAVIPPSGPVAEEKEKTQRVVHFLRLPQEPQLHHLHSGLGVRMQHGAPFKCTDPENETAVKLIQGRALTSLHSFINILMEERISQSPAVFFSFCFGFMVLHTCELLLHNGTGVKRQTAVLQRREK